MELAFRMLTVGFAVCVLKAEASFNYKNATRDSTSVELLQGGADDTWIEVEATKTGGPALLKRFYTGSSQILGKFRDDILTVPILLVFSAGDDCSALEASIGLSFGNYDATLFVGPIANSAIVAGHIYSLKAELSLSLNLLGQSITVKTDIRAGTAPHLLELSVQATFEPFLRKNLLEK